MKMHMKQFISIFVFLMLLCQGMAYGQDPYAGNGIGRCGG